MKKRLLITYALLMSATIFAAPSRQVVEDVSLGLDCELFINPYLESELKEVSGHVVLDAGCGLAPRSIFAAKQGATVCAIDSKKHVIDQAHIAVARAGVESQMALYQGDIENLPYESKTFDHVLSVNKANFMPATMHVVTQDQYQITGLEGHFRELARVMKDDGRLIITAPSSYGVVFTDGSFDEKVVQRHIKQILAKVGQSNNPDKILHYLSTLDEVMRATFVRRDGKLQLVTDETELREGEQIWCKVPSGVASSYYHSEEEYLIAMQKAGLICQEIKRPCFFGNVKFNEWKNSVQGGKSLGKEYVNHHPFTIYYVAKKV